MKFIIFTKSSIHSPDVHCLLETVKLYKWLQSKGHKPYITSVLYLELLNNPICKEVEDWLKDVYNDGGYCDIEHLDTYDLNYAISLGGDGTVLKSHRFVGHLSIPIITVAMGTLNFMCEYSINQFYLKFDDILTNKYDERLSLSCNMFSDFGGATALNEIVIKNCETRIYEYKVYINGKFYETIKADGLIVATSNGSTAYAMSNGGPIMDPDVNAVVLVPISPFKLSSRPLVVSKFSEIRIEHTNGIDIIGDGGWLHKTLDKDPELCGNGFYNKDIIIKAAPKRALIVCGESSFYDRLQRLKKL